MGGQLCTNSFSGCSAAAFGAHTCSRNSPQDGHLSEAAKGVRKGVRTPFRGRERCPKRTPFKLQEPSGDHRATSETSTHATLQRHCTSDRKTRKNRNEPQEERAQAKTATGRKSRGAQPKKIVARAKPRGDVNCNECGEQPLQKRRYKLQSRKEGDAQTKAIHHSSNQSKAAPAVSRR